jgi:hypothetical protein
VTSPAWAAKIIFGLTVGLGLTACLMGSGGCGSQSDPFVGTWRLATASGSQGGLVIATSTGGYVGSLILSLGNASYSVVKVRLTRANDELRATTSVELIVIKRGATQGHLTFKEDGQPALEFVRISDSTAVPSSVPAPATAYPTATFPSAQ